MCTLCSFPLVAISRFLPVTSRKDTVTCPRASLVPLAETKGWWRSTTRTTFPSRGSRTIMHLSLLRLTAHVCVCDVLPFPFPGAPSGKPYGARMTVASILIRVLHVCMSARCAYCNPGGRPTPTRASVCPYFGRGKVISRPNRGKPSRFSFWRACMCVCCSRLLHSRHSHGCRQCRDPNPNKKQQQERTILAAR